MRYDDSFWRVPLYEIYPSSSDAHNICTRARHSACCCVWPYQSRTCSLIGFEHTQPHLVVGITYVVDTCMYDPLGVLSDVSYLSLRLHKRMRLVCSLSSCMVSRMGPMCHMYPGGPNIMMCIRRVLLFLRRLHILSQCGPARFPGVFIYQSMGVDIQSSR